ncbi:MAG TPA: 30S ribosomal protein S12 methylthiotransferase RimO [Clostridiales bacterium]|nr:30S ribosomal protein S12 methylthiotransferase RimO [Clostridiales bacterium]
MKIGAISLGCDKNRVDTEKMLSRLVGGGHTLVGSEEEADVIVVNTCAFIDKAKEESIDEILSAIAAKNAGKGKKVIVTGCLAQRYADTLKEEFPEVDAILGIADYDAILKTIEDVEEGEKVLNCANLDAFYSDRVLTTPYHYAYLKIADGCSNHCTYCAIPSIRGKYRSEKLEDLIREAKKLSDDGVKELILVAQDVTRYGTDFDGKPHLIELLDRLSKLDFVWIRLLYLYPEMVDDKLIEYVENNDKIAKYMDIPLQHVDDDVLKRMNRRTNEKSIRELIAKLKNSGIAVRTTFICGFPGETQEQFEKLEKFVKEVKFDYAGFFAYSREEGTPADKLDGHLDESVKEERANKLRAIQEKIIKSRNKELIGSKIKVIYDDIDYDRQKFVGRSQTQAPDIDNVTLFESDEEVRIGEFYDVEITGSDGIDLVGKVIK